MKLLGLDLETTGLNVATDEIVEFGVIIYDVNLETIGTCASYLVQPRKFDLMSVGEISGISTHAILEYGQTFQSVAEWVGVLVEECDFIVAHNGLAFDKPILERQCQEYGVQFPAIPWIDTMIDVPYPDSISTRALVPLAAYHGFLNPFPHRALFDVMTMLKILSLYDIHAIAETASTPVVWVRAKVSYDNRNLVKAQRFQWDSNSKLWVKKIRQGKLLSEAAACKCELEILPQSYIYGETLI